MYEIREIRNKKLQLLNERKIKMGRKFLAGLLIVFCSFFLTSGAFAGFFQFFESGFTERVLKERVENDLFVDVNTVAVDNMGNLYFFTDDRASVLSEYDFLTLAELGEIKYTANLIKLTPQGEESIFAEGKIPLKSSIGGLLFGLGRQSLLIFLTSFEIDEEACPFLSPESLTIEINPEDYSGEGEGTTAWNWSGLEGCFFEKVSIVEITGFRVMPFS